MNKKKYKKNGKKINVFWLRTRTTGTVLNAKARLHPPVGEPPQKPVYYKVAGLKTTLLIKYFEV